MPLLRMLFIILIIGAAVAGLQIIIWRISRGNAFFKYIPSIVLAIVALICVIKALWFSTGMEDLAYFVTAILVSGVFAVSIITGIVLDVIDKIKR